MVYNGLRMMKLKNKDSNEVLWWPCVVSSDITFQSLLDILCPRSKVKAVTSYHKMTGKRKRLSGWSLWVFLLGETLPPGYEEPLIRINEDSIILLQTKFRDPAVELIKYSFSSNDLFKAAVSDAILWWNQFSSRSHGDREDGTALSQMTLTSKNEDAFNEGDENNTLEKKVLHQTRTDRQTTTVTSTFEMFVEENNCNDEESVKTQRKEILPYFYNLEKSPPSSNQSMHSHFDYDNCSYESLNSDDDSDSLICLNVTQKHVPVPNEIQVASSQCVNPGMEHMNDVASVPHARKQLTTFRDSLQSTHGSRSDDVIDLTQDCVSPILPRRIPHGTLIYLDSDGEEVEASYFMRDNENDSLGSGQTINLLDSEEERGL
jgi:hypothetical protein